LASQNRDIVDENIFLEIREGQIARFWEELWQQRGKMLDLQEIQNIYRKGITRGLIFVKDYWKEGQENEEWREWKKPDEWDSNLIEEQKIKFNKELESRKIKNRGGPDILRWGKETKGTFTIKEAYNIKIKQAQAEEEQNWRK